MNPKCPNCGLPMTLKATRADNHHTFECKGCKVTYMTEDHIPITGRGTGRALMS